jgi:hypothetical protein
MTRYYPSFLTLFTSEILENGTGNTLAKFVFSAAANGNDSNMLMRFVGGAYVHVQHAIISGFLTSF